MMNDSHGALRRVIAMKQPEVEAGRVKRVLVRK